MGCLLFFLHCLLYANSQSYRGYYTQFNALYVYNFVTPKTFYLETEYIQQALISKWEKRSDKNSIK